MDIKDFILLGGGILIALVVCHGFWLAWRAKREPLRMDIVPDLVPEDVDEMERLRGELPNGGARIVNLMDESPDQTSLFDDPSPESIEPTLSSAAPPLDPLPPELDEIPLRAERKAPFDRPKKLRTRLRPAAAQLDGRGRQGNAGGSEMGSGVASEDQRPQVAHVDLKETGRTSERQTTVRQQQARQGRGRGQSVSSSRAQAAPVEELLILNLIAPKGQRFSGEALVIALRRQGLRYGDMNIFHRTDPASKIKLYSVANAVEPGTFDLSDLDGLHSPGMTFFLQLPGPEDASDAFEEMLRAARNVAAELGGEVRDEGLSLLTGQITEHMRQRIADFARRRLSKRA